uniref:Uncharacterized protein n=1 Tax=Oryza punctata TaxID=4537 RepID=A0A0E0JJ94_ORYPU
MIVSTVLDGQKISVWFSNYLQASLFAVGVMCHRENKVRVFLWLVLYLFAHPGIWLLLVTSRFIALKFVQRCYDGALAIGLKRTSETCFAVEKLRKENRLKVK